MVFLGFPAGFLALPALFEGYVSVAVFLSTETSLHLILGGPPLPRPPGPPPPDRNFPAQGGYTPTPKKGAHYWVGRRQGKFGHDVYFRLPP